jgi:pyruvate ferredoxin oxidoreductase gamma subunit
VKYDKAEWLRKEVVMSKITEIRWHGRGGQGAKTASLLLAESALEEGKYIQGFPEYGPERMGAPMQSFTRISQAPISLHSHVRTPDAVVVLDSTLLDTVDVTLGLPEKGVILVNSPETPQAMRKKLGLNKGKVFTVDATSISLEILGKNLPNTPMLGALIKVTSLLNLDTVASSIKHKFGKKFSSRIIEGNIEAIKKAYEEVKEG